MSACPDDQTLTDALLGRVPGSELNRIEAHLVECPACLERSRHLSASDAWVDLIQRQKSSASGTELSEFAAGLMARLKSFSTSDIPQESESKASTDADGTAVAAGGAGIMDGDATVATPRPAYDEQTLVLGRVPKQIGTSAGDRFGEYEILETIARGGMGVVFRARHSKLNREVALKMILASHLAGKDNIQRFYVEAEAAARLNHPGIVPIYEVGEHDGQHFFSMALMDGGSLIDLVKNRPLEPVAAARLIKMIAEAVQYAHSRNIVHRDLKPANVLLDTGGQPRIADFGLAKNIDDDSGLTASGQVMGTPGFMPPEQAAGRNDEVGPLADVYSLGAILYYLLTRQPPFRGGNVVETLRQVIEQEAVSPRQLNREVDRDLATICLKCLSKDPGRRYASAAELAEELSRYLAGYPIKARPVTQSERIWRWCRRNPVTAGLGIAALTLLLATTTIATVGYLKETRLSNDLEASLDKQKSATEEAKRLGSIATTERDNAVKAGHQATAERTNAQLALSNAYFDRAGGFFDKREIQTGLLFLAKSLKELPPGNTGLAAIIRRNIASWCDEILAAPVHHFEYSAIATCAAFLPTGDQLAVGCRDGSIVLWDVRSGDVHATKMSLPDEIWKLKVSRDGMKLIAGCMNGTARLWNLSSQEQIGPDIRHTDRVSGLAFSPDSRFAVTGSWDRTTRYLSTETGLPVHDSIATSNHVGDMEFSPDGKFVIASDAWLSITVREFETGNPVRHLNQSVSNSSLTISHDGRLMAMGTRDNIPLQTTDNSLRLVDFESGKEVGQPFRFQGWVNEVAFNADSTRIMAGGRDNVVRLFDPKTVRPMGSGLLHAAHIDDLQFAPQGNSSFTLADGQLRVWHPYDNHSEKIVKHVENDVHGAEFSRDGTRILVFSGDRNIQPYDADRMVPIGERVKVAKPWNKLEMNAEHSRALVVFADKSIGLVELATGQLISKELQLGFVPQNLSLNSDEDLFAMSLDAKASIWSFSQGKAVVDNLLHPKPLWAIQFTPDGQALITACRDGVIRFWNTNTGSQARAPINIQGGGVRAVEFSHDGRLLAVSGFGTGPTVWDMSTSQCIAGPFEYLEYSRTITVDHAATLIAVGGGEWNDPKGYSSAGLHLHHIRVWSIFENRAASRVFELPYNMSGAAFSPDSRTLLTSCLDGNLRTWSLDPQPGTASEIEAWLELLTGMFLDSRNAVQFLDRQEWNQRRDSLRDSSAFSKRLTELLESH